MLRRVDLRGKHLTKDQYQKELPRATLDVAAAMIAIEPILQRVKTGTEADLISLGEQFDGVRPPSIRVPQTALDNALAQLDPADSYRPRNFSRAHSQGALSATTRRTSGHRC